MRALARGRVLRIPASPDDTSSRSLLLCAGLRHHPLVNTVLHAFWKVAVHSGRGPVSDAELLGTTLNRNAYHALYSRVYAVLLDDNDPAEATASIEEDWLKDAKGDGHLTNSEFGDALFELSDLWVRSVSAEDYADFLWALYHQIADPLGVFRPYDECVCDGAFAADIDDEELEDKQVDSPSLKPPTPPANAMPPEGSDTSRRLAAIGEEETH